MKKEFEVVIFGAGPAGTCAALRLLKLGYNVAIIEQSAFPRSHIGESLSPGIWNIFQYLDAEDLLNKSSYLKDLSAHVIWETPVEKRMDNKQRGPGIIVDRSQLDLDLLALCKQRGAVVYQPAKVERYIKEENVFEIKLNTKNGKELIYSHFIFDARGKNGVLKSERIHTAPLSIGIWAHIESNSLPNATLIEALDDGWLWGSPLPNNTFRILSFSDPKTLKSTSVSERLQSLVKKSNLFQIDSGLLKSIDYQTCPVQSYWNAHAWKDQYIHIGESAFALDPLSSTGVEKAMRFSLQAVIAFNTLNKKNDLQVSKQFYSEKLISSVVSHTQWTQDFYRKSWLNSSTSFWKDRSTPFDDKQWEDSVQERKFKQQWKDSIREIDDKVNQLSIKESLERLRNVTLQVSKDVTYSKNICVVGDLLEIKEAIQHPNLKDPIAYYSEVEITSMLKKLSDSFSFKTIINDWTKHCGEEKASRLVTILWNQGIFEIQNNI